MPKKFTVDQVRKNQVCFASTGVFRLGKGKSGQQQAQEGGHGLVLPLQECLCAILDGSGNLLHFRRALVRATNLACKEKGRKERTGAHGQKEVDPTLCCHKSSEVIFLSRIIHDPRNATPRRPVKSHRKAIIRVQPCRVIAVTGIRSSFRLNRTPHLAYVVHDALYRCSQGGYEYSMTSSSLLTPRQAAEKLGISYPALKHWILAGRIRTVKTPGGHHRIPMKFDRRISSWGSGSFRRAAGLRGAPQLSGTDLSRSPWTGRPAKVVLAIGEQRVTALPDYVRTQFGNSRSNRENLP